MYFKCNWHIFSFNSHFYEILHADNYFVRRDQDQMLSFQSHCILFHLMTVNQPYQ